MSRISNDIEFRQTLGQLELTQQRRLAAMFIESVISLSGDERIGRVLKSANNPDASVDEMARALKEAKTASLYSYTRCGAEADWREQAGYFVARAAEAAVMPEGQIRSGGPAWQAAMSCRMARTCLAIDTGEDAEHQESETQYQILTDYLNEQKT